MVHCSKSPIADQGLPFTRYQDGTTQFDSPEGTICTASENTQIFVSSGGDRLVTYPNGKEHFYSSNWALKIGTRLIKPSMMWDGLYNQHIKGKGIEW